MSKNKNVSAIRLRNESAVFAAQSLGHAGAAQQATAEAKEMARSAYLRTEEAQGAAAKAGSAASAASESAGEADCRAQEATDATAKAFKAARIAKAAAAFAIGASLASILAAILR